MSTINQIASYLKWWKKSLGKRGFGIHSPFLFHLITQVIHKKINTEWPYYIENRRKQLMRDRQVIEVTDFGSGSKLSYDTFRKIGTIAKGSATSAKDGRLLYHLANHMQSKNILELGTSLGLGTCYLAHATSNPDVITIEGCPEISKVARGTFDDLQLKNIRVFTGEFSETLPKALNEFESVDLVFFDGNHQYGPTLSYFHQCLPKVNNRTVFVFDDIHQSPEMEQAWAEIIKHPSITLSLDFYWIGVVFFRKELSKEHFCLRR
jgi:predicted O-methyltransferase YrrM